VCCWKARKKNFPQQRVGVRVVKEVALRSTGASRMGSIPIPPKLSFDFPQQGKFNFVLLVQEDPERSIQIMRRLACII
jgi:hypothetical protein